MSGFNLAKGADRRRAIPEHLTRLTTAMESDPNKGGMTQEEKFRRRSSASRREAQTSNCYRCSHRHSDRTRDRLEHLERTSRLLALLSAGERKWSTESRRSTLSLSKRNHAKPSCSPQSLPYSSGCCDL